MRKSLSILVLVSLVLAACSSSTLKEAISKSGLAEHDNPEILYRSDEDGIVIFLTKDEAGSYIVCRSVYIKNNDRYKVESTEYYVQDVDIFNKYEFLTIDSIEDNSDNPKRFIWGGIFHYPRAEKVQYSIRDEKGEALHEDITEINSKHIFLQKLPNHLDKLHDISYQVLDEEGNVLYDQS